MKKLLFVAMACVLCIGLVGGAFAYFSDTETSSDNTFTAGTLDLVLSNDGSTYTDGVSATWVSPSNWAPGEKFTETLYIQNAGTIDGGWIGIKPMNINVTAGPSDFADKIIVNGFSMADSTSGKSMGTGDPEAFADMMATWGIWGSSAPLTLAEFASGAYYFYTEPTDWLLLANNGTTTTLIIEFEFDPDANDDYQGAACTCDIVIKMVQDGAPMPNFTHIGDASP